MQYRKDRAGNDISLLGYGCMRFTQRAGKIDIDKAEKEVMAAIEAGVNYFDTAYIYPGSETAIGEILHRNGVREKVNIATKLPHYLVRNGASLDKFFETELKRLQTDYVDFYLMHMLPDVNIWEKLKGFGIEEWIAEKKKTGQIRQVGFSYHGNPDTFKELLDAYDWDFCMIQYNYMDERTQAGRDGIEACAARGIPVMIMEPLRGGKLAGDLPKSAVKIMNDQAPERTPAEWSFRWLFSQPEVTCVLSGMNSMEMLEENLRVADETLPGSFTEEEETVLDRVVSEISKTMKVGCTGCRYCMPCPKNVDIPGVFAAYNKRYTEGFIKSESDYIMCTSFGKDSTGASNCVGCGLCEKHCPQNIEIRKELKNVEKAMEGIPYKVARRIIRLLKI